MAQPLRDVLDYLDYAHGCGRPLTYLDFVASDLKAPLVRSGCTVVFPDGWTDQRRLKWRQRHKLTIPEVVMRSRNAVIPHAIASDESA